MFVCVFIDWENIEKTAKQEYGSVLNFSEFVQVIHEVVSSDSDLRHVIKRLQKQGKTLRLMGFQSHTSQFIIDEKRNQD